MLKVKMALCHTSQRFPFLNLVNYGRNGWPSMANNAMQVADETVDEDCLVKVCQTFFLQEGVSQMKIHGYYTDAAYQTTNYDDRAPEKGSTIVDRRSCKLSLEKSGSHFPTRLWHMQRREFLLHRPSKFCLTSSTLSYVFTCVLNLVKFHFFIFQT